MIADYEHFRILIELARVYPNRGYLAEWHLKPKHPTSIINEHTPTMYVLRDQGLVEELANLHCRWRLTEEGRGHVLSALVPLCSKLGAD